MVHQRMKNHQRNCTVCGLPFEYTTKRGRPPAHCSDLCKANARTTRERFCSLLSCDNEFNLDDTTCTSPYFCSEQCVARSKPKGRDCAYCHRPMPAELASMYRSNFCSHTCIAAASAQILCQMCGDHVMVKPEPPWFRVQMYCSDACRQDRIALHDEQGVTRQRNEGDMEANEYLNAPTTSLANGKLTSLPTHPSGRPFLSVRPVNLESEYVKNFAPSLRNSIAYHEYQILKYTKEQPPQYEWLILLLGLQEYMDPELHVPADHRHPRHLASLAECYPFLSDTARQRLELIKWRTNTRPYFRKAPGNSPSHMLKMLSEIQLIRQDLASGAHIEKMRAKGSVLTLNAVTLQMIDLWKAAAKIHRLTAKPPPQTYLPKAVITALAAPTPPLFQAGPLAQILNREANAYHSADSSTPWMVAKVPPTQPRFVGTADEKWARILDTRGKDSISTLQFAQVVYRSGMDSRTNQAKDWARGERDWKPEDIWE